MNKDENLDLTKILKYCPKGTKFYSSIHGNVNFDGIRDNRIMFVYTGNNGINNTSCVLSSGLWTEILNGECILFPSKDQRDWSKWQRPLKDGVISLLKPFDKVLVRNSGNNTNWRCGYFSHYDETNDDCKFVTTGLSFSQCVPYNDETKHLLGTTEKAPEKYINW